PEPWVTLVRFLVSRKRKPEVPELLGVAEKSIAAAKVPLAMAQCYAVIDEPKKANDFYKKALDDRPRDAAVLSDYAAFLMQRSDTQAAEGLLRRLLEDDVKKTQDEAESAHGRLAVVLSARGDYARLKEALPHVGLTVTEAGEIVADASLVQGDSPYM